MDAFVKSIDHPTFIPQIEQMASVQCFKSDVKQRPSQSPEHLGFQEAECRTCERTEGRERGEIAQGIKEVDFFNQRKNSHSHPPKKIVGLVFLEL